MGRRYESSSEEDEGDYSDTTESPAMACGKEFVGSESEDYDDEQNEWDDVSEEYDDNETDAESDASQVDDEYDDQPSRAPKAPRRKRSPILRANLQSVPEKCSERVITISYRGSLHGLSVDPGLSVSKFSDKCGALFEGDKEITKENANERCSNHQIHGIRILRVHNNMPVPLILSTNILPTEKQNAHDTEGNSGIFVIFAEQKSDSLNQEICGKIGSESDLLNRYPDHNLDNLEDDITHMKKKGYSLVPRVHPVIEKINKLGVRSSACRPIKRLEGQIKVGTDDVTAVLKTIKKETQERVKGVNLYDSQFSIARAFVPNVSKKDWIAENGLFDNEELSETKKDVLGTVNSCFVTLAIKYKTL